ncbi:MAG: twin-arginine translocation signal domain-containing protein [Anaerolineales bacterium]|nr:twin-arginine translocation signal domain-containing protein [Anaerolineales bacterium]
MWNRRQFIKALGVLGGVVAAPLHRLGRAQAAAPRADLPPGAELYGGFLLLPEGAPVPEIVKVPQYGAPNVCGLDGQPVTASTKYFTSALDLARSIHRPLFTLGSVPSGLKFAGAYCLSHGWGDAHSVTLCFDLEDSQGFGQECAVSLWAEFDFYRPYPIWSNMPVEVGGPSSEVKKVDFLPVPGVWVAEDSGHSYHWIMKDILYTLVIQTLTIQLRSDLIIRSLTLIE